MDVIRTKLFYKGSLSANTMKSVLFPSKEKILFAVSFIDIFGVSLVVPLLNHYLLKNGYSNFKIGIMTSVYSGMQFIFNPIVGHLSDLYGRESVLFVSILTSAICYILLGTFSIFLWVFTIRVVLGATKHTQLLCKTIIEDENPDSFQSNYGKLNGFIALGFIIGPIIGGYLVDFNNGFFYISLITGFLFLLNSILVYFLLVKNNNNLSNSVRGTKKKSENFILCLRTLPWTTCWDIFLIRMISTLASNCIVSNYNLAIREKYELSSVIVGYTYSFQGFIGAITGFSVDKIAQIFPKNVTNFKKLEIIYSFLCATFLCQFFAPNFYIFVILLIPFVISCTLLRVTTNELLFENSDHENLGLLLGTFNNITSISRLIIPIISGVVIDFFNNYNVIYLLSFVICVFGLIVIKICRRSREYFKIKSN